MTAASTRKPVTRVAVLRRIAVKFIILCVAIVIGEMLFFHFVARDGWLLSGPWVTSHFDREWQTKFGDLPPQGDRLVAPVGRAPGPLYYGREYAPPRWYRIEDAAPAEEFATDNGLVLFELRRGPNVPLLRPLILAAPHMVWARLHEEWYPAVSGQAHMSSDGRLWCRVTSSTPIFIRTREYVGRVDDFLPPSSARGWKTTHFSWAGLAGNVFLFLIAFGWVFFARDVWRMIGYNRYRERLRRRMGLCVECGYDLQSHKDGRCPECGTSSAQ